MDSSEGVIAWILRPAVWTPLNLFHPPISLA
jgi:hypothetical protein